MNISLRKLKRHHDTQTLSHHTNLMSRLPLHRLSNPHQRKAPESLPQRFASHVHDKSHWHCNHHSLHPHHALLHHMPRRYFPLLPHHCGVYFQAPASQVGAAFFTSWIVFIYFGAIGLIAISGRLLRAFARDLGLPFSAISSITHSILKVPVNHTTAHTLSSASSTD